jgi:hypothetical protein
MMGPEADDRLRENPDSARTVLSAGRPRRRPAARPDGGKRVVGAGWRCGVHRRRVRVGRARLHVSPPFGAPPPAADRGRPVLPPARGEPIVARGGRFGESPRSCPIPLRPAVPPRWPARRYRAPRSASTSSASGRLRANQTDSHTAWPMTAGVVALLSARRWPYRPASCLYRPCRSCCLAARGHRLDGFAIPGPRAAVTPPAGRARAHRFVASTGQPLSSHGGRRG